MDFRRLRSLSIALVCGALLLAGCGGGEATVRPSVKRGVPSTETNGDLTKPAGKEPAKAKDAAQPEKGG